MESVVVVIYQDLFTSILFYIILFTTDLASQFFSYLQSTDRDHNFKKKNPKISQEKIIQNITKIIFKLTKLTSMFLFTKLIIIQ